MKVHRSALAALTAVAVAAAGCGDGEETSAYSLVSVTGNVSLDGKPLEGARVIFTPQGNLPDTPGSDTTGKEGNYKIMYRGRSGVAPGKYLVLVSKTINAAAPKLADDYKDDAVLNAMATQGELAAAGVKAATKRAAPVVVNSTMEREVGPKGEVLDFDLKKP